MNSTYYNQYQQQMGVCCSYESSWQQQQIKVSVHKKTKKRRSRKQQQASIIIQERSSYEKSFASKLQGSFRDDVTIDNLTTSSSVLKSSLAMGSVLEMSGQQQQILIKNLTGLNPNNQIHTNQPIRLCNLKTKNFLHTHKIKLQKMKEYNQISCCPYNSTHTLEYDVWELIPISQDKFYIFHPFTSRYLSHKGHEVVAAEQKQSWTIHSLGPRRNLGFIRIECQDGWLCMSDEKGLVKQHRKIIICNEVHISHLWELIITQHKIK